MKGPTINLECCILCEICVEVAPQIFRINDVGYIEIISLVFLNNHDQVKNIQESIFEAVKNCPKDCIICE